MSVIPVKVLDRFRDNLSKLQKVIEQAKNRDINEADTVVIVTDVLTVLFGYDKYTEITREYAIKNTYCDLAIKLDEKLKFLIEVKAIGIALSDKHYQQALDYGANNGTEWIVLTNGLSWKIYKVRFEKPIRTDFICEFNLLDIKLKNQTDLDKLYILCKEGIKKNAIDEFSQHKMIVNKYFIGTLLQSEPIIELIKKEFKKIDPLIKFNDEEILGLLVNDVIKREVLDAQEAIDAKDKYMKVVKKLEKMKIKTKETDKKNEEKIVEEVNTEISSEV
ncbi:MAG: restriction endonuclease subunit R [Legionellales bacterium]|nr:restriction endonuclease subunit R [Legionellales bacterium]